MAISLSAADWLRADSIQAVFDVLEQNADTARVVGGAVRNSLLEKPVSDIDIATTAEPKTVVERAGRAGLKVIPTGIDHGTVTIVSGGIGYEITTLREDVETFGRQATVRFGRDWEQDARRRDFTMNALYCDRAGNIHDPLGGLQDCLEKHVRFIGDPNERIREDYLRILRFFRIHAMYGLGEPDPTGLTACVQERDGLRHLSAERIGMEMKRLVVAPLAAQCVSLMESHGLMEIVTGGVSRTVDFSAFRDLREEASEIGDAPLALAALAGFVAEDMDRLANRFRLSNADRKRMQAALDAAEVLKSLALEMPKEEIRRFLFRHGRKAAIDGLLLVWSHAGRDAPTDDYRTLLSDLREVDVPRFPVKGRDLLAAGVSAGPKLGVVLETLERRWLDSGCTLSVQELLSGDFTDM